MLGSGNDATAAPDGDAPTMPDDVDQATAYEAPVVPDDVDPVIEGDAPVNPDGVDPVVPAADAPMTPGVDAPMIPDASARAIPGDTAPRSGWHLGTCLGILITLFSSSGNRNESLSAYVKSTHVAGGSVADSPLPCVLSKVSSTRRLNLVLAAS